jgi:hypothetical protein
MLIHEGRFCTDMQNAQSSQSDPLRQLDTSTSSLPLDGRLLSDAHRNMGQIYMDRQKWRKASMYMVMSKQTDKLAECLFHMGDFTSLRELQTHLPENSPVHKKLAAKYESLGMYTEAVESYVKVCFHAASASVESIERFKCVLVCVLQHA